MITFSRFGKYGRLGNQLFQYAAMLGFADRLRCKMYLPEWEYAQYFEGKQATIDPAKYYINTRNLPTVKEETFAYDAKFVDKLTLGADVLGYFQSEKYFDNCRALVRNSLAFKKEFTDQLRRKYWKSFSEHKKVIAIHIRRGDYVGNKNYEQLPITYFISALFKYFPDWKKHNIILFGDDIGYCKVHFDCLQNVAFAEGNSDIEDLALMSMCHHFILSNSSFSWWGAYLGQKNGTRTVRPWKHFAGALEKSNQIDDFYPTSWAIHKPEKLDLRDVTFTIPVSYDSRDRKKNLDLCVCLLQHNFKTNIIVGEQGGQQFAYMAKHGQYKNFNYVYFHRTKMLNEMARAATTKFVANWDADVTVPPLQLWDAVDRLRKGADMVYPYGGMFARVPRLPWFETIERQVDIGVVGDTKFNGMNNTDEMSVGGAIIVNKDQFLSAGAENEHFVSFGPEDVEREYRFKRLGFKVERTLGALYHINHFVGANSSNRHAHVKHNRREWELIANMSKTELVEYIQGWAWLKTAQPIKK